jgi:hypothetical protein
MSSLSASDARAHFVEACSLRLRIAREPNLTRLGDETGAGFCIRLSCDSRRKSRPFETRAAATTRAIALTPTALCLKHRRNRSAMKTRLTMSIVAAGALVSLVASTALAHEHDSEHKSKPFIENFGTVTQGDTSAPTAGPQAGDQNPLWRSSRPPFGRQAHPRQHPRQQFQQCR